MLLCQDYYSYEALSIIVLEASRSMRSPNFSRLTAPAVEHLSDYKQQNQTNSIKMMRIKNQNLIVSTVAEAKGLV